MYYKISTTIVLFIFFVCSIPLASAQTAQKIGNNSYTINPSAVLEIESTSKGFLPPRMTATQRDAIGSPAVGLTIYNTTKNCLEWYNGSVWYNGCGNQDVSTANGTGIVSSYSCSTASAGTLTVGTSASGVTQTITATVSTAGTYSISAIANGVTFSGSGTFAGTGAQNVVLTASGTPVVAETSNFVLNTTPNCSFSRAIAASCGAFVAAGVYKEFMCHNLGADTSLDPNVPVQGIHGNYYQWGKSAFVANASTSSAAIAGWNTTAAANGSWSDASKTVNDPCPTGYRVPTNAQWQGVVANNTASYTAAAWTDSATNYGTAIHFGPNTSTYTLTLPAAGERSFADGTLSSRGIGGNYWSSTERGDTSAYNFFFYDGSFGASNTSRNYGISVRCVSE